MSRVLKAFIFIFGNLAAALFNRIGQSWVRGVRINVI